MFSLCLYGSPPGSQFFFDKLPWICEHVCGWCPVMYWHTSHAPTFEMTYRDPDPDKAINE